MLTNNGARSRRRHIRALVLAVATACLATVAVAPAAGAQPIVNSRDRTSFSYSQNYCGVDVDSTFTYGAQELRRINKNGFPLYKGMFFATETHTNPENGQSVVVRGSVTLLDLKATDNGDGTYTLLTQQTGLGQDIRLDDGTHVGKYAGRVLLELIYDYNGTPADQSDDIFLDGRFVSTSGQYSPPPPHDAGYCEEIAASLT